MKAILAVNNLGFIGLNHGLPWHCKDDFMHFKALTKGGRLLVGWNTFHTLPPLKGRELVLDLSQQLLSDEALSTLDWCIGGRRTYEKYQHMYTELHISHIDDNSLGDVMFPDFRYLNPDCKIFNYSFKIS